MPVVADTILLDAVGLGRQLGATGIQGGGHGGSHADSLGGVQGGAQGGVRDVNFTLRRGDVLGLLGLNGAGKSTTLRLLAGVLAPDAGSVTIAGHSLLEQPLDARARLGYLPDTPPLYPEMHVEANLLLAARLRRLRGKAASDAVARVIERCGLGDVRRQRVAVLSKGFRQRVGLAQALVHDPEVLLLDEPGSGLDPQQTEELRHIVGEAGRDHCVVFSTHLLHEARSVCNRIAVVHAGLMVAEHPANGADLDAMFARLAQGLPDAEHAR